MTNKFEIEKAIKGHIPAIGITNEVQTWMLIKKIGKENLAKYPTTLEEDLDLLKKDDDNKMSLKERNCI
jgi:hypothetical protein